MNYFNKLQLKVNKYKIYYAKKYKKAVIKLIWWNFLQLFRFKLTDFNFKSNHSEPLLDRISIHLYGGIGDMLIGINYSYYLFDYLKNDINKIDIYVKNPSIVKELVNDQNFNIYSKEKLKQNKFKYLLSLEIVRFPLIIENNLALVDNCSDELKKLVKIYEGFYQLNPKIVYNSPQLDSLSNF